MNKKPLQDVWDYLGGSPKLGDIAGVRRGKIKNKQAETMIARGDCVVCEKFAKEAMIHESPGKAKCCHGCPAEHSK